MHVRELWRFPVKSVGGERLDRAQVTSIGLVGDRACGVIDTTTGLVLTARRAPTLLQATARWVGDHPDAWDAVTIDVDGAPIPDDAALSDWLGRPVRLVRAGDEGGTYENPLDVDDESDWVRWTGPARAWHDSTRSRLSLVSTATIGDWDPRRFRSNVLLDGAPTPGEEDTLVGATVRLGDTTLAITKQIDRCIMVTREQPGVTRDREVLRAIHRDRDGMLAIGALVTRPGTITVGDTIRHDA